LLQQNEKPSNQWLKGAAAVIRICIGKSEKTHITQHPPFPVKLLVFSVQAGLPAEAIDLDWPSQLPSGCSLLAATIVLLSRRRDRTGLIPVSLLMHECNLYY
jgi:hypothetical protein